MASSQKYPDLNGKTWYSFAISVGDVSTNIPMLIRFSSDFLQTIVKNRILSILSVLSISIRIFYTNGDGTPEICYPHEWDLHVQNTWPHGHQTRTKQFLRRKLLPITHNPANKNSRNTHFNYACQLILVISPNRGLHGRKFRMVPHNPANQNLHKTQFFQSVHTHILLL